MDLLNLNLTSPHWSLMLPQLIVFGLAIVLLLGDAFLPKRLHYNGLTAVSLIGYAAALTPGQGEPERGHGDQTQRRGVGKCHAPTDLLADPGRRWHTADIGDGQAHEHGRHRAGLAVAVGDGLDRTVPGQQDA